MNDNSLIFKVIWKDDEMIEIQISVDNGRYSGTMKIYEVSKSLLKFVNELNQFPFHNERITHCMGGKDSSAYFEMDFYKIGPSGKCGVLITMEENVSTEYRKEEKDKLSLELLIEPNSINNFCKELQGLAEKEEGTAELKAIDKYTSNLRLT